MPLQWNALKRPLCRSHVVHLKKPYFMPCTSPSLLRLYRIFSGSENVYSIKKHRTLFQTQKKRTPHAGRPYNFKLSGAVAVPMP